MAVENIPHWTILPNWRTPVMERLECLTAVLASPSGAEQRFAARWSPRRYLEPLVTPVGRVRTLFDMAVGAVGASSWYVPVWHDTQYLTETLGIGDTVLNCETEYREFAVGGHVMLWRDEFTSTVLEVASMSPTSLTFVAGPAASWPAGTRLFPAVKARLAEMPSMGRRGPRAIENSIRFIVETENDYTDAAVTLPYPTYDSFMVLTTHPDEGQDITHGRMRLLEDIDGETGLSRRYDTASIDFTLQRHHWLNVGRQEHAEIRSLFYALDGRRGLLWLPTFANDFEIVADADDTDTSIEVALCGFTAFGGPRFGRDRIWIKMRDGTNIFREITGSALTIDGTETIQLDAALGADLTPANVARISFMALSRLDSDIMEIEHATDTDGASRVALNFRSAPNLRVANEWAIPTLPMSEMTEGECGATNCTPYDVFVNFGWQEDDTAIVYALATPNNDSGHIWFSSAGGVNDLQMLDVANFYDSSPFGYTMNVQSTNPGGGELYMTIEIEDGGSMPMVHFMQGPAEDLGDCDAGYVAKGACTLTLTVSTATPFRIPFSPAVSAATGGPEGTLPFETTTASFFPHPSPYHLVLVWDGSSMALYECDNFGGPVGDPLGTGLTYELEWSSNNFGPLYIGHVELGVFPDGAGDIEVLISFTDFRRICACPE
jgi:hypothetical protein